MTADSDSLGTVITFYSYKGGTGRSMAVANAACILAEEQHGDRGVLMIDWDLEAPGLHRYFESRMPAGDSPGLLEMLCDLRDAMFAGATEAFFDRLDKVLHGEDEATPGREHQRSNEPQRGCAVRIQAPFPLWMIKSGRLDADYTSRLATFDWEGMFRRDPTIFTRLARELTRRYRYVLIDSRTGINDSSGICSMLMPEKLVLVFTPNHQSLDGVHDVARRAAEYRKGSRDLRPLTIFPLPSRIESQDPVQRATWRAGGLALSGVKVVGYEPKFERQFEEIYGLENCSLKNYFDDVQVQHDVYFAYGERVAMLESLPQDRFSLANSYRHLARYLVRDEPPWSTSQESFDIFFSYHMKDRSRVRQLVEQLKSQGLNPWFDEIPAPPSASLESNIEQVIYSAKSIAICLSDVIPPSRLDTLVALARRYSKPIISIVLENYQGNALPAAIAAFESVDLRIADARRMADLIHDIIVQSSLPVIEPLRPDISLVESYKPFARGSASPSPSAFVPPLVVHLCWFDNPKTDPSCAAVARELYEILHRPLQDDVVHRPGIEIPVEYGRSLPGLLDALDRDDEPATSSRLVIAILDAAASANQADRATVRRALERWGDRRAGDVLLPVIVGGGWQIEFRTASEIAPITLDRPGGDAERRWILGIQICMAAGRALLPRPSTADPPHPRVLISYARADGAQMMRSLEAHFHDHTEIDTWHDRSYAPTGEELGRQLQRSNGDAVVLVVRTDRYSERPECVRELLAAKQSRAPIVTLIATVDGEFAAPAYSGNHRTMTWRAGRELEVAARCVQAWLHGHHFRAAALAALALAGLPADSDILPRCPELLDLIGASRTGRRLVVHPDPPLNDGEATVLRTAHPGVRIATPTTLFGRVLLAQDPEPPLTSTTLAFSLSVAEDLPRLTEGRIGTGLTQDHVEDIVYAIVLATLRSGARIAYGGDVRLDEGYTRFLVDLHRSYGGLGTRGSAQLIRFLDPEAREGVEVEGIEFDPTDVPAPPGSKRYPELHAVLWHLAMREVMSERCAGRILLGGRTRPSGAPGDDGYRGPWPGLLEDAWRTLRRDRALYVVGGFGGAAGLIAAMLSHGEVSPPLTRAHHAGTALAALQAQLDVARGWLATTGGAPEVLLELSPGRYADIEDLAGLVLARWQRFVAGDRAAWPNGLDVAENLRLFRSTDRTEIMYLVFEGLRRLGRKPDGELQLAIYRGDIASVPQVDGYAVTATPGVPSVGALAALEPHMDRPRRGSPDPTPAIALEAIATSDLSGSHVLVAQLALPPIGQPIDAAAIERLAYDIARKANGMGLESIACSLFATTFGLSVAESARAIVTGFRRGLGRDPAKLVFCELDSVLYEQLRNVLGREAVELRAGVVSPVRTRGPVLHIDMEEPRPSTTGRVSCTLYLPEGSQPIAPLRETVFTWTTWQFLRQRLREFDDSVRVGRCLWRDLLSDEIRTQLIHYSDRALVVLGDEAASSIPWELLMEDRDGAPFHNGGIVRRIPLSGPYRSPADQVERSRLRVLVVADPRGDLPNAMPEADAVCAALGGRADVIVRRFDGAQATVAAVVAELERGYHDVFHYTGHDFFDERAPERSGLFLADGVLAAADLPPTALQLVFFSAHESGRLRDLDPAPAPRQARGKSRSLAEAFLRAGVRSFIATFYAVDEVSVRSFASIVHAELAAGRRLGDAMRAGRRELHRKRSVDWGNFLLYGDDDLIL